MKKARRIKLEKQRRIAKERVDNLFRLAEANRALADRYIKLARDIAMKVNLRLPFGLKRKFCKSCGSYLRPGVNARVRTRDGKLVYYCCKCKKITRIPIGKKKRKK